MKKTYFLFVALIAGFTVSCKSDDDGDTTIPDPGKNVAGAVAGTYPVRTVLSGSTGSSTLVAGAMTGSGTVTLAAVNDSTVTYSNQTELTVTASGQKISLKEGPTTCFVEYNKSRGQIYISQRVGPGTSLSVAQIILKNRVNVSRSKLSGYDVSIEYSK